MLYSIYNYPLSRVTLTGPQQAFGKHATTDFCLPMQKFYIPPSQQGGKGKKASPLYQYHRKIVPESVRLLILERDEFACVYCAATEDDERLGIDHVIPVSQGGDNSLNNLVACCRGCNSAKGGRTIEQWDEDEQARPSGKAESLYQYFSAYIRKRLGKKYDEKFGRKQTRRRK